MLFRRKVKPHDDRGPKAFIEVRFEMGEVHELLGELRDLDNTIGDDDGKLDRLQRGLRKQHAHLSNFNNCTDWEGGG